MSVLATFSIPSESFVLGDVLRVDGVDCVEFERVVPSRREIMPYFWVWGEAPDSVEEAIVCDTAIDEVTTVDSVDSGTLYKATWNGVVSGFISCIQSTSAMLVDGHGTDRLDGDEWTFELRFPDRSHVESFHTVCDESDLGFRLVRLFSISDDTRRRGYGLTETQRETLQVAAENGYFEQPREISSTELAEHFDVTSAAISGRLRRAERRLIEHTLLE
ncbi:helix-turn-helix domain-containing protein [Natronobiforma cellulositropha]|uniref:helix-turn-helix domain-containing protein n=1 Tax=Natronobiforma cellulositropha TaxID=1679076 RepID=UPI0021D5A533|nr:helix-turn-helix domain-containing protein [Natronobiforma cellulositropha]